MDGQVDRRRWWHPRWRPLAALLVLALAGYAAAGYWLAPWLLRKLAPDYIPERAGATLSLGEIAVDPFRLRLEIADAHLDDGADTPLLAAERLVFDLELASLWRRAWVLSEATIIAPRVRAEIGIDGSLNLAALLPENLEADAPLPDVRIAQLTVDRGQLGFVDHSRAGGPRASLLPVHFQLQDFHSTGDGGGFALQAVTDAGESVAVQGRLSLAPYASQGHVELKGLRLVQAQRFITGLLPFDLAAGQADLGADYRIALAPGQPLQLEVEVPRIELRDLAVRARGVDEDWLVVPAAKVQDIVASLQARRLAIGSVQAEGAQLRAWREADGSLNLQRLLGDAAAANAGAAGWNVSLGQFGLAQGRASLQDRAVQPAATFEIDELQLRASELSQDLRQALPLALQARVNGQAQLRAEGTVVPADLAADLEVALEGLPLQAVASYLPTLPSGLRIRTGDVAGHGRLRLGGNAGRGPLLEFEGDGSLSGMEIAETAPARPLLSWQRVDAAGLRYRMAPDSVEVERLAVRRPYARVLIDPEGRINLVQALGLEAPSLPLIGGGRRGVASDKPKPARRADAGTALAGIPPVRVERIELVDGTLNFTDLSIEPNFSANVEALGGSIRGLSTRPDGVARIDLAGHVVNRHSPVKIQGESTVMAFDRHTDLRMEFRNIELPVFNPYSGRFAGYAIDKGKLTTELHYRIDDRALVADHHVVIDQLQWGQATDSKDKVSLPVRLGTSLLKDRNGVIDLQLPVTGSLDDPKFRIGPLVWQVLKNLVVKVVASPFAALGALFEGAEQAQFVDFAPGSAELGDPARQGLSVLAAALADKPELSLEIPAAASAGLDAQVLGDARFHAALASASGEDADAWDYAQLDEDDRYKALRTLYRQVNGTAPDFPDEVDDQAARGERKPARVAWLEDRLRPGYEVPAAELAQLAQRRAGAVQEALVAGGAIDPSRVFVVAERGAETHEAVMRMELKLQ